MQQESSHSAGLLGLLTWIEINKNKLLIGAVAAAVVILVIVLFVNYQSQKEIRASEALSEIKVSFNPSTPAKDPARSSNCMMASFLPSARMSKVCARRGVNRP